MLTHIVIWKYRPHVEQEVREEHLALLRDLTDAIPEVVSLSVGFDTLRLPRSYDTGIVVIFRDRAGLDAYQIHPKHVRAAEFGRKISDHIASVDFENS